MSELRDDAAIPTPFQGVQYRSRTEARWAVFFDALGLDYRYEPELLTLSTRERYLPDFWIEDFQAWFEVKPNNEAVVTEECVKARILARDLKGKRVWLAMGAPSAETTNILPLDHWGEEVTIEQILEAPENRYKILEDRRDEQVYWLLSEFVQGSFSECYVIGGPGVSTDHDRLPMMMKHVDAAYKAARAAKFED